MIKAFTAGICIAATACAIDGNEKANNDQIFTAQMADQTLEAVLPNSDRFHVHAVCGPSTGRGFYGDDHYSEFQADSISDGRLVFFAGSDNTGPNVAFRDAGGQYIFALQDGGDVRIVDSEARMWVISYPSTGVVETHNFFNEDGKLVDMWTANKPAISSWQPSARVFMSRCFRP